jgi:PAS domain S-box-containing protein
VTLRHDAAVIDLIEEGELPLVVVATEDRHIRSVNLAAIEIFGASPEGVVGHDMLDFVAASDRGAAGNAFEALRQGVIDFYRAHRELLSAPPASRRVTVWVRSFEVDDQRLALILLDDLSRSTGQKARLAGITSPVAAMGSMDASGIVSTVSCDIRRLLGVHPREFVGRRLLDRATVDALERYFGTSTDEPSECAIAVRCELEDATGVNRPFTCSLSPFFGEATRGFVLYDVAVVTESNRAERASDLERHLWRIASEVQASGILDRFNSVPQLANLPQMADLTSRQWEILSHLLQGQRVPTIAAELYLSQSTVRNSLSAVFKRFGVHSQAELLRVLKDTSASSS